MLIIDDMAREIYIAYRWVKALVAFVVKAIANKYAFGRAKFQFVTGIRL